MTTTIVIEDMIHPHPVLAQDERNCRENVSLYSFIAQQDQMYLTSYFPPTELFFKISQDPLLFSCNYGKIGQSPPSSFSL